MTGSFDKTWFAGVRWMMRPRSRPLLRQRRRLRSGLLLHALHRLHQRRLHVGRRVRLERAMEVLERRGIVLAGLVHDAQVEQRDRLLRLAREREMEQLLGVVAV